VGYGKHVPLSLLSSRSSQPMRLLYHPAKRLGIHYHCATQFLKSSPYLGLVLHGGKRITYSAVLPNLNPIRQLAIFSTAHKAWSDEGRSSEEDSTIYALSTAPGRAAIAIIRISGPECIGVCQTFPVEILSAEKADIDIQGIVSRQSPSQTKICDAPLTL